ncbi:class F sortase, partial [Candidatus Saccharibacteria bacterium]|nr:class F sortase [Candidatus Saccharibacteria bacterium]
GPRPGGIGSAVIDGHFGWKDNKPAVFDKLHTLVKGDAIYVEDENKVTHTFIVIELRSFQPEDDATTVFQSNDNTAHLNLITCQGIWNQDKDSYSTRLVVFAESLME